MYTLKDFLNETDASLGIAIKHGDGFLYMKEDNSFVENIYDSKEFIYDEEVVERVSVLNKNFDEDNPMFYISVYFNSIDDSLCDIFTLRDLKRAFEEFKKDHKLDWDTKFFSREELGILEAI